MAYSNTLGNIIKMKAKVSILLIWGMFLTVSCRHSQNSFDLIPLFGHRYTIIGDFDGDKKVDTLTEHFKDKLTNSETNKFFECLDTTIDLSKIDDSIKSIAWKRKTIDYLSLNSSKIDTLIIRGQYGLYYIKNVGDINEDERDEIALINDYADFSSMNSCIIYKFYNHKWTKIYSFIIHEDWIPTYDWNGIKINTEFQDPVNKIGLDSIEIRECDGGDEKIVKLNMKNK